MLWVLSPVEILRKKSHQTNDSERTGAELCWSCPVFYKCNVPVAQLRYSQHVNETSFRRIKPKQVIEYLRRYTHKVAISNSLIQEVSLTEVTFKYKDYKDGLTKRLVLTDAEFTCRFTNIFYQKHLYASGITASSAAVGNRADCKIYRQV